MADEPYDDDIGGMLEADHPAMATVSDDPGAGAERTCEMSPEKPASRTVTSP